MGQVLKFYADGINDMGQIVFGVVAGFSPRSLSEDCVRKPGQNAG